MTRAVLAGAKLLLTWVAAHILYGYLAVEYPTQTRQATRLARQVIEHLDGLNIPDKYMVWADLLLQPATLTILLIAVLLRVLLSLVIAALMPRD